MDWGKEGTGWPLDHVKCEDGGRGGGLPGKPPCEAVPSSGTVAFGELGAPVLWWGGVGWISCPVSQL